MKYLDSIVVTTDKYANHGIKKGTKGAIVMPEIRYNSFECELFDLPEEFRDMYYLHEIDVSDMKVTRESDLTDDDILEDLPNQDPHWWCKVEDGYIINLLGERKNKIPYDYDS